MMRPDPRILRLQSYLESLRPSVLPGAHDGIWGQDTARSVASALRQSLLSPDAAILADARTVVAALAPDEDRIVGEAAQRIATSPKDPRRGVWTDKGEWALRNMRHYSIPILRTILLHRDAFPAFLAAFSEIQSRFPALRVGKTSCFCLRRKNWNPKSGWTTHVTGYAIDVDWDSDGKWERVEDVPEGSDLAGAFAVLRSWGFTLGEDWSGKSKDGMHIQWLRL